jgi:hypothetical protein
MRLLVVPALLVFAVPSGARAQAGRALDAPVRAEARPGAASVAPLADLGAARAYLERRVRADDPARYARLDPALTRLESRDALADGVVWTAVATTLGTLATAAALAATEDEAPAAALFAVSGGVMIVGLLLQAVFRPSAEDVRDLFRLP